MTARRVRRHGAGAQRGAAFYLFVVLTLTMTAMLFSGAAAMRGTDARAAEAERVLADARRAVLAYLTQPDVPARVCINEAVEIAKRFGGEWQHSGSFVNRQARICRDGLWLRRRLARRSQTRNAILSNN